MNLTRWAKSTLPVFSLDRCKIMFAAITQLTYSGWIFFLPCGYIGHTTRSPRKRKANLFMARGLLPDLWAYFLILAVLGKVYHMLLVFPSAVLSFEKKSWYVLVSLSVAVEKAVYWLTCWEEDDSKQSTSLATDENYSIFNIYCSCGLFVLATSLFQKTEMVICASY
jgi:hypothetical protein